MTTISAYALQSHSPEAIKASRSWSLRCLESVDHALKNAGGLTLNESAAVLCGRAKSMGSFNLGMLEEVGHVFPTGGGHAESDKQIESKVPEATAYFEQAFNSAKKAGFQRGQKEAIDALRRLHGTRPVTRSDI